MLHRTASRGMPGRSGSADHLHDGGNVLDALFLSGPGCSGGRKVTSPARAAVAGALDHMKSYDFCLSAPKACLRALSDNQVSRLSVMH